MLRHFEHQRLTLVLDSQRIQDQRQFAITLHVDDRAQDLRDLADGVLGHDRLLQEVRRREAATRPRRHQRVAEEPSGIQVQHLSDCEEPALPVLSAACVQQPDSDASSSSMGGRHRLMTRSGQKLCPASARKVGNGYNLDHRSDHPAARWRRWILRVQPVWCTWSRRRSRLGPDHSYRALARRRREFQPPLTRKTGGPARVLD
jgi:hypothetical protein